MLRISDTTNNKKLMKGGDRHVATTNDGTGKPTVYVRYRNYVQLLPVPDGVYIMEVYYKTQITDISLDADEPLIPKTWHEGIVMLARYKYFDEQPDYPKAQYAWQAYKVWLADKPTEIDEESVDIDSGVEVVGLKSSRPALDFDHSNGWEDD